MDRLVIHLILAALFSNNCLAQYPSLNEENHSTLQCENGKMKIGDLNADVLYLIVDELDAVDSLNLVEAHPTGMFTSVATSIFRRKYNNFYIKIFSHDDYKYKNIVINTRNRVLTVYNFGLCLKMLKYVASAIQQLEIETMFIRRNESYIINEYVNEYAGEWLEKLNLGVIKEDTFAHFTVPLKELIDLSFHVRYIENIRMDVLPLNELCPKLQRLTIDLSSLVDYGFINCAFQHLEYLSLSIYGNTSNRTHEIEGLLRKNQQLQRIEIGECPSILLKAIDELSPNIETLKLHNFDYGNEMLTFNHVKHLILAKNYHRLFENFVFPQLESLQINYFPEHHDAWKQFFKDHKHMHRMHLMIFFDVTRARLVELTSQVSHLTELILDCTYINVQTVEEIIRDHTSLKKFQFSFFSHLSQQDLAFLRHNFTNDWHIEDYIGHWKEGLSFEKINSHDDTNLLN